MQAERNHIDCTWPHHDGSHKGCNQCGGAGSLPPAKEFRFVLRGHDATWRRRIDMEPGDVDCTGFDEEALAQALLSAGCSVYESASEDGANG